MWDKEESGQIDSTRYPGVQVIGRETHDSAACGDP